MLIFGPAASPTISAVIWYPPTLAGSEITLSSSTTRTAASVMLEPTSPESLSTFRTSSTDTFSCRPPARTIAYTRELSLPRACPRIPRYRGLVCQRRARLNLQLATWGLVLGTSRAPKVKVTRASALQSNRRTLSALRLVVRGRPQPVRCRGPRPGWPPGLGRRRRPGAPVPLRALGPVRLGWPQRLVRWPWAP